MAYLSEIDEARAVEIVSRDVRATLGTEHVQSVRHQAAVRREVANSIRSEHVVSLDAYVARVAEEVQQYFHDCHVDSTWPRCPIHERHPLWLQGRQWICEQDNVPIAPLGGILADADVHQRYRIRREPQLPPAE